MITAKTWNRFFLAASILVIILFFFLNVYTPLITDDFSLSLRITSLRDIFISVYNSYFDWGGRIVLAFFYRFWLLIGKPFFNIANTIVYCVFILLVQFHITGNAKKPSPALFLALNVFFWFFAAAWGQVFLWLTGSCVYLWTTVLILFFLVPFRKKQDDPEYRLNIPLSILLFLAGILAGWSVENSGAAVLFLLIAYFIIKIRNKNKINLFEILGSIGFLIGFSLLLAAPGNYVRIDATRLSGSLFFDFSFGLMFLKRFIMITYVFAKNYGFLLILISIILGIDIIYRQKQKLNIFPYIYVLAALAGAYSMLLAPSFPDRAFLIVTVFAVIALGNILVQMKLKMPSIITRNGIVVAVMVIITLSGLFLDVFRPTIKLYSMWQERIEHILSEKEKGNFDIVAEPLVAPDRHMALHGLYDIIGDENFWVNTAIAQYFGLRSIKAHNNDPMFDSVWFGNMNRIKQLLTPWKTWEIIDLIRE